MKTLCLLSAVVLLHLPSALSEEVPPFLEEGKDYMLVFGDKDERHFYKIVKKINEDWLYVSSNTGFNAPDTFEWVNLRTVSRILPIK